MKKKQTLQRKTYCVLENGERKKEGWKGGYGIKPV